MTFTTPLFFLAGIAAVLIPIAIHLLSKGKPKRIVFPALRFAQERLASNRRRLSLKRILLLCLRCALFISLGLLLARPFFTRETPRQPLAQSAPDASSESGEAVGISGRDGAIATAIVVDTSARMGRVKENATLFDRAIATARTIVDQTSKGSELAILDGTYDGDAFQPDRFAAKQRLDKLHIQPAGRSAAQSTLEAIALVKRSKLQTREIFVITDSTRQAWPANDVQKIRRMLAPNASQTEPPPTLYFVDLGDGAYRDAAIVDVALSAETVSAQGALRVDVDVERVGENAIDLPIETVIFDPKKLPDDLSNPQIFTSSDAVVRRETQTVSFGEGRSKRSLNFQISELPVGPCVGAVRIIGGDALEADDARWFAFEVADELRLLVVAPEPVAEKALFISQALAPDELRRTGRAPFELDAIPYKQTAKSSNGGASKRTNAPRDLLSASPDALERYRAILLLDPPAPEPNVIEKLTAFVENGGGVGVFLGREAAPTAGFQTPEAVRFFGYKPASQTRVKNWNAQILPRDYTEPLLAQFRQFERYGIPWDALPVGRYWKLEELAETAAVVATFAPIEAAPEEKEGAEQENEPPAIVENRLGRGLVATLATPVSDSTQDRPWNALTSGDAAWVFVVLADGFARRLASSSSSILNYSAGEVATLRSPLKIFPAVSTVTTPRGESISTPTDVERRQIRFPGAKEPGIYRVRTTPNKDGESIDAAFAVATSAAEFDMTRYPDDEWKTLWDGVPYKKLDLEATGKALETARREKGTDPYAFLAVLLAAIFLVETGVANRFYKK